MTTAQFSQAMAYTPGTVLRDASGCIWVKKWCLYQRPGSLGDYGAEAMVWPVSVLWEP